MISETASKSALVCICPECKNKVDLSKYPNITEGMIIECDHCGMTLIVKSVANGTINTEIVDEGK